MRAEDEITNIISMYAKHGWKMRRVLLTPQKQKLLPKAPELFLNLQPIESELDAIWFSRAAKNGGETWELRFLGESPLALLEVFEESDTDEVREAALEEIQARLFALISRKDAAVG